MNETAIPAFTEKETDVLWKLTIARASEMRSPGSPSVSLKDAFVSALVEVLDLKETLDKGAPYDPDSDSLVVSGEIGGLVSLRLPKPKS